MAYSNGRGVGFRPIGLGSRFGPSREQVEGRWNVEPRVPDRRGMTQPGYHRSDQNFPALAPVVPPWMVMREGPPPPPTWMGNQRGPGSFNPSIPPPATFWGGPPFWSSNTGPKGWTTPRGTGHNQRVAGPQHPGSSHTPEIAFNVLVDKLFRYLQLSHHRRNWRNLPRSLNGRLSDLERDITPPLMDSRFRGSLAEATQAYKNSVKEAVLKHFDHHLGLLTDQLKALKPDDVERAGRRAMARLGERLGRRFQNRLCREDNMRITRLVGTKCSASTFNTINTTNTTHATVKTNNTNETANVLNVNDKSVTNRVSAAATCNSLVTIEGVEPIVSSPLRTASQPPISISNHYTPIIDVDNDNMSVSVSASNPARTASPPPPARITRNSKQTPKVDITFVPKLPVLSDVDCIDENVDCIDEYPGLGKKTVIDDKYNIACKITDDVKILIIGDSNLRKVDPLLLNKDWHILCIPGVNLEITTAVINGLPVDNKLTDIIITSGICDSNNDPPPISSCLTALDRLNVRKHFVGISFNEGKFKVKQCTNLRHINFVAKEFKSINFIPPLEKVDTAYDGIHHTDTSVALIMNRIVTHIDSFLG